MVNEMIEKKISINQRESGFLVFLYRNFLGRILLKIITKPMLSRIVGWIMDSRISTIAIKRFIKKNNIDINEYEEKKYSSYNDFFTRKIKPECRKVDMDKKSLIAPCDSKLTVYN